MMKKRMFSQVQGKSLVKIKKPLTHRWRLVIHSGVDGFTRIPVFIHCSTDNKATTVLELFLNAVENYGLPSRVRSGKGVYVEPSASRTRKRQHDLWCNVHNQRIERLWRDVFGSVIKLYYEIFYQPEDLELLDPSSELDLFSLHYVFVPKINKHLNIWKNGWVNHKLSSEAQYTPLQLFISRMLDDDYQNDIFQENVLASYKFQLIISTYVLETVPNLLNNLPSSVSN